MSERAVLLPGPAHPITTEANPARVVVSAGGKIIADSILSLTLREASYPAVRYIPRADVDMAALTRSAQTLLALQYGGDALADPFGFPVRLRMSTKLGYKNPKWVTAIEVTNTYPGGYWEKLGFPWFAGI